MFKWRIPLSDLDFGPEEEAATLRVLRSKWLSMGPEVEAFEQEFADFIGTKHAVAVASGTAALHLAFLALDLGPEDEVVQPALNFVAAANMTVAVGAVPVFADIVSLEEPTLDPADLESRITARTKAVVVMHYAGYLSRMAEIRALCRRHNLTLVEDACHAVGARYLDPGQGSLHGKMAGSVGDVACFSFFSNKNLAAGEGGMLVTDRDDFAQRVRLLRSHGMTSLTWDRHRGHASSYDVAAHGYNYRLDELRAAIARCQLEKLPRNNSRRKELVATYRRELAALTDWKIPFRGDSGAAAYHLMVVLAPDQECRAQATALLRDAGVQTSLHYPCLPAFTAFQRCPLGDVPNARSFSSRAITLPLFPTLQVSAVEEICVLLRTQTRQTTGGCGR